MGAIDTARTAYLDTPPASAALVELHSRLADLAYTTADSAEPLADLITAAADDGMDPYPLERVARYLRIAVRMLTRARDVAAQATDDAEDHEAAARDAYLSLLP